ncbi:MAG: class I SAM-dependent methyltransferase [Methanothrix sp.]|nr:class I SAM-dependent methyltransferase [Methanothrix sp.]
MQNDDTACLAEHWRGLSQKRRDGPQSALFWDKRAEVFSRNIKGDRREKRRAEVFELIKKTGLELNGANVLDIGCGPGTLAVPLAEMGARVTALDISAQMLKRLENRSREEGLTSIKTILSSWCDIDIDAQGFRSRFDLVIASMTPGINGPETFDKMMQASRNVCYYSNFVSRKWDISYYELYQMLFGEKYGEGGYGFHLPFMYLYSMGCRPVIKISKNNWKSDETVDSMVETVSGFFGGRKDIDDEMRLRMRRYFEERAEGGNYHSETESITGMMVWEKNGR